MISISKIVEVIISVVFSSGIVLIIIKAVGNKIIETQFEKTLENYRYKISSRFDRISKIHEKEFQILPLIWEDINSVNAYIIDFAHPAQEYPGLAKMSDEMRNELYKISQFRKSEIHEIESSYDKQETYESINYRKRLSKISTALIKFNKDYSFNKIFLADEINDNIAIICESFEKMYVNLKNSIRNKEIDFDIQNKVYQKSKETNVLIDITAKLIKTRLSFSEAYSTEKR